MNFTEITLLTILVSFLITTSIITIIHQYWIAKTNYENKSTKQMAQARRYLTCNKAMMAIDKDGSDD